MRVLFHCFNVFVKVETLVNMNKSKVNKLVGNRDSLLEFVLIERT